MKPSISPTARQILADRYTARSMPWFAQDILKGDSRQFDAPLEAITELLNRQLPLLSA